MGTDGQPFSGVSRDVSYGSGQARTLQDPYQVNSKPLLCCPHCVLCIIVMLEDELSGWPGGPESSGTGFHGGYFTSSSFPLILTSLLFPSAENKPHTVMLYCWDGIRQVINTDRCPPDITFRNEDKHYNVGLRASLGPVIC